MPDLARTEFTSFVGREHEIGQLRALMRVMRAVTLCGAGGIGKTRLALRLFAEAAPQFGDGAWFVELGELREPDQVTTGVAAAMGVDEEPGRPLLDTLAETLRDRHVLLVLDNCEHLVQACARVCHRLLASSPRLQVIATSREPLRVAAEAVWPVPPLALPPRGLADPAQLSGYDAIRLFTERAARVAAGFTLGPANAAGITAICRALDGLPLAIELAAAWVRVLSVDQIAARLDHRLALLTSSDRSVPARQQTLRATFDWSYELLTPAEQVLLRRLSALAGWSLDMAEQVCGDEQLPGADVLDLLTALADKSLVEVEPEALGQARYRMLDTIREYASGLLAQAGETQLLRRRRREYTLRETESLLNIGMARVQAPWSARVDVFRRFDLEAANLREVLGDCVADGDADSGLRLCTAMRPVWIVRGAFAEGAGWFDRFLALDDVASVPASVRGPAMAGRAQLAMAAGSEQAEELAEAGLELCWAAGEPYWVATALNLLTEIALHAGRLDEAAVRGEEALRVARSAQDRWNEGYALGTMAATAASRGDLRESEQYVDAALAIMREIDQQWGSARALLGLGDLARVRGDGNAARDYYLEALAILRQVDARPEIARCLAGLGRIAMEQSDLATARQDLTESLQLSYVSGSRIGIARGLEMMARLAVLEGDAETGVRLGAAVTGLRAAAGLPPMPAARVQRLLDPAAGLGEQVIARLWADGKSLSPADAVRLALGESDGNAPAAEHGSPEEELTPREREVAALLGRGLTNRAIAAELFISPATAARHVANILAKLGFSSRSQVAVWAKSERARGQLPARGDDASPPQAG
jgi:predicted ATPase/DNA-binding CsgD family transcriptional regulator